MLFKLPNELLVVIYKMSDIETRVKLNKVFNWNFRSLNPYENIVLRKESSYKTRTQTIFYSIGGHMLTM
jgi:hypothetical protein